jgi:phosphate starvation-inducible PhoH-like protein
MNTRQTKTSSRRTRKKLTPEEEYEAFEAINKAHSGNVLDKMKIDVKCKTQNQKKLVTEIKNKEIVICSGLPGTGKTFLSCAVALELLKSDPRYRKIVIVKSVTTLKDEEIGFLKGTMKEKMEPFMYSFMHNFEKVIGKHNVELLRANNMIEEMPIAYMRGINIDNSITIIDEAQNISIDNIRTIMTRLGENSKMIFLGDENQIDMKKKGESSLNFIIQKFSDFDEVGTITLGEDDVVRNPLIKKIEKIFNESKT